MCVAYCRSGWAAFRFSRDKRLLLYRTDHDQEAKECFVQTNRMQEHYAEDVIPKLVAYTC
ncbi:hypothetical protein UYA_19330 [Ectopseudomonas alcaliphila JAB1]|jgi:hypothetical protein|nr:hypothetical protein UYA_19330 [Pseudomonas alcaliphila JAB1]